MPGPDLASIVTTAVTAPKLRLRTDVRERGWTFWELRTLNMHRVVGLLREDRPLSDAHALETSIRGAVSRHFKRSWWRGMGFGVVAQVATLPLKADDLIDSLMPILGGWRPALSRSKTWLPAISRASRQGWCC